MPRYQWITEVVYNEPYLTVMLDNGDVFKTPPPPWYPLLSPFSRSNWRETSEGIEWPGVGWSIRFPELLAHVRADLYKKKPREELVSGEWMRQRILKSHWLNPPSSEEE